MIFHKTKRITSAVILLIFLVSDLARAGLPIEGNAVGATQELSLEIPAELGSVQETFLPAPNADAPFVIHLETPHAHYESVLKIKEIIQYLRKRYKVDLVFAEGASKALHPEFLRFFDDSGLNQKMLDALAQKGELTGVDLALGMPPYTGFASAALPHSQTCAKDGNDLTVVGIENPDFYRAAYHAFKKVIENLDQSQALLDQAKAKLDQKASKIFPRELRDLVATWQKFSSGQRNVVAAAKFLAEKSKESIRLDFEDPLSQFEWPQLTRLVLLTELEKKFDKNALEKEKEKLTRWLREKKISSTSPFSLSPEGRGLGESESPRRHYERFLSEVYPKGFRFADYPQLTYFAASRVLKSELEASRLFPEFDRLFDKLFEAGTKTDEERKLIEEYKQLLLIQKLLRLELTREEWKKIKSKNRENFFPPEQSGPKKTLQLFRYRGGENPAGIFLQGTGWGPTSGSPRVVARRPAEGEEIFSANVLSALRFYRLTERREAIFLKNLSNEMEKRHVKKAILVTGGFHTEGLTELFKKEGIGFANLTPHITGEIDSSLYHQIMLRRAHLEKPEFTESASVFGNRNYFQDEVRVVETAAKEIGKINSDAPYFADRDALLRTFRSHARAEVRMIDPPLEPLQELIDQRLWPRPEEVIFAHETVLEAVSGKSDQVVLQLLDPRGPNAEPKELYEFSATYNIPGSKLSGTKKFTLLDVDSFEYQFMRSLMVILRERDAEDKPAGFYVDNHANTWAKAEVEKGRPSIPTHYALRLNYTQNHIYLQINDTGFYRIARFATDAPVVEHLIPTKTGWRWIDGPTLTGIAKNYPGLPEATRDLYQKKATRYQLAILSLLEIVFREDLGLNISLEGNPLEGAVRSTVSLLNAIRTLPTQPGNLQPRPEEPVKAVRRFDNLPIPRRIFERNFPIRYRKEGDLMIFSIGEREFSVPSRQLDREEKVEIMSLDMKERNEAGEWAPIDLSRNYFKYSILNLFAWIFAGVGVAESKKLPLNEVLPMPTVEYQPEEINVYFHHQFWALDLAEGKTMGGIAKRDMNGRPVDLNTWLPAARKTELKFLLMLAFLPAIFHPEISEEASRWYAQALNAVEENKWEEYRQALRRLRVWAAGRAEVRDELVDKVRSHYELGEGVSVRETDRPNFFLVESNQGKYLLKAPSYRDQEELIAWEAALIDELKKAGVLASGVIKNKTGIYLTEIEGRAYVLYEYLEGKEYGWGKVEGPELALAARAAIPGSQRPTARGEVRQSKPKARGEGEGREKARIKSDGGVSSVDTSRRPQPQAQTEWSERKAQVPTSAYQPSFLIKSPATNITATEIPKKILTGSWNSVKNLLAYAEASVTVKVLSVARWRKSRLALVRKVSLDPIAEMSLSPSLYLVNKFLIKINYRWGRAAIIGPEGPLMARGEVRTAGERKSIDELMKGRIQEMNPRELSQKLYEMASREEIHDHHASFFIDVVNEDRARIYIVPVDEEETARETRQHFFRGHFRIKSMEEGKMPSLLIAIKPPYLYGENLEAGEARDRLEEASYSDLLNIVRFLTRSGFPPETLVSFQEFKDLQKIYHLLKSQLGASSENDWPEVRLKDVASSLLPEKKSLKNVSLKGISPDMLDVMEGEVVSWEPGEKRINLSLVRPHDTSYEARAKIENEIRALETIWERKKSERVSNHSEGAIVQQIDEIVLAAGETIRATRQKGEVALEQILDRLRDQGKSLDDRSIQIIQRELIPALVNREELFYLDREIGDLNQANARNHIIERHKETLMIKVFDLLLNLPYGFNTTRPDLIKAEREMASARRMIFLTDPSSIPHVLKEIENGRHVRRAIKITVEDIRGKIERLEKNMEKVRKEWEKAKEKAVSTVDPGERKQLQRSADQVKSSVDLYSHNLETLEEQRGYFEAVVEEFDTHDFIYEFSDTESVKGDAKKRETQRHAEVLNLTQKYFPKMSERLRKAQGEFDALVRAEIEKGRPIEYASAKYFYLRHKGKPDEKDFGPEVIDFLMRYYDIARNGDPDRASDKNIIVFAKAVRNEADYNKLQGSLRGHGKIVGILSPKREGEFRLPHWFIFAKKSGIVAIPFVDLQAEGLEFSDIHTGDFAVVDGKRGEVVINPTEGVRDKMMEKRRIYKYLGKYYLYRAGLPALFEGREMPYLYDETNLYAFKDEERSPSVVSRSGGKGVGLLRLEELIVAEPERHGIELDERRLSLGLSELLSHSFFHDGKPLIVRLFDVAEDKRPRFLAQGDWDIREILDRFTGVRFYLSKEEKYREFREFGKKQLRALFAAHLHKGAPKSGLRILFSDVRHASEIGGIEELVEEAKREFIEEVTQNQGFRESFSVELGQVADALDRIPIGYMFEHTKTVEEEREAIFQEIQRVRSRKPADRFVGIGTNDLMKSIFQERLGGQGSLTEFNPFLIRDIWNIAQSARTHGVHVTLEGEWGNSISMLFTLLVFRTAEGLEITPVAATQRVPILLEIVRNTPWQDLKREGGESFADLVLRAAKNDHPPTAKELEKSAATVQKTVENRIIGQEEFNRFVDQLEQQELNGESGEGGHNRAEMRPPKGTADTKSSPPNFLGRALEKIKEEQGGEGKKSPRSEVRIENSIGIRILGGTEPGASGFLFWNGGTHLLLDAGLEAGSARRTPLFENLPSLDAILLSHGHLDHTGALPIAVSLHPEAHVYTTWPTAEIATSLFWETLNFVRREGRGGNSLEVLRDRGAVRRTIERILPIEEEKWYSLKGETKVRFIPASHIVGANLIEIASPRARFLYTGDFSDEDIQGATSIRLPEEPVDFLVMEATYGDRLHDGDRKLREEQLAATVARVIKAGGSVLIPSATIGRATNIVSVIRHYQDSPEVPSDERIPSVPVYVEGSAALNLDLQNRYWNGSEEEHELIFGLKSTVEFVTPSMSEDIEEGRIQGPYIIVGGHGMLAGGAAALHLKHLGTHEKNAVILVGYQAPDSPGASLLRGKKRVRVNGETVRIKAEVIPHPLSAHADQKGLVWLAKRVSQTDTKIFLIHGDRRAKEALREALQKEGITHVVIPNPGDNFPFNLPETIRAERKQSFDHIEAVPFPLEKEKRNPPRVPYVKEDNPVYPDARLSIIQTLLRRLRKVSNRVNRGIMSRYLQTFEGKETKDGLNEAAQAVEERLLRDVSKQEARQRENAFWQELVDRYGADLIPAERLRSVINETNQKRPQPSRKSPEQKYQENLNYFTEKFVDAFSSETARPQEEEIGRVVGNFLDKHRENGNLKSSAIAMEMSGYLNPDSSKRNRIKHTAEDWRNAWEKLRSSAPRAEVRREREGKIIGEGGRALRRNSDRGPREESQRQLPTSQYPLLPSQEAHSARLFFVESINIPLAVGADGAFLVPLVTKLAGPRGFEFVTAIGTLGVGPEDWDLAPRYRRYLRSVILRSRLGNRSLKEFVKVDERLRNPARDGVGIRPELRSKETNTPITLLIDSRALNPKDRSEIRSRLETLPEGSIVTEYVNQEGPASVDILSPLMHEFPMLKYSRQVYRDQIKMDQIREALLDRGSNPAMRQHTAILFSSLEGLENLELENLGIAAFQFDAARVTERYRSLPGLSAAVFGEVAEYAKLGRELNERTLHENQALGLFGFRNGVYSFLESWFDARTSEQLVSASA